MHYNSRCLCGCQVAAAALVVLLSQAGDGLPSRVTRQRSSGCLSAVLHARMSGRSCRRRRRGCTLGRRHYYTRSPRAAADTCALKIRNWIRHGDFLIGDGTIGLCNAGLATAGAHLQVSPVAPLPPSLLSAVLHCGQAVIFKRWPNRFPIRAQNDIAALKLLSSAAAGLAPLL